MRLSVVVPIYKVEKYLDECVQSILRQKFTDFELILVDDGSPDNCPQMCDEYAAKDSRVKVIHQKNAGLACARNAGIVIYEKEWTILPYTKGSPPVLLSCFLRSKQGHCFIFPDI